MEGDPLPFEITEDLLETEVLVRLLTRSTSLFAGNGRDDPHPTYCGSGSLVSTGKHRCLLTAEHVWTLARRSGTTLFLSRDQTISASREPPLAIEKLGYVEERFIAKPESEEWGPDLALLRIPELHADVLEQRKAFYNLDRRRDAMLASSSSYQTGLWAVLGAAGEEATFGPEGWDMQTNVLGSTIADTHARDGFDYLDLLIKRADHPLLPRSLGGLSGAGLWRCSLKRSSTGKVECDEVALEGVAFYEDRREPGFIRCHGRRSIYARALG